MNPIAPGVTRVGWVGAGIMGLPMARHLLNAGYKLTVATRTPSKAAPLVELGATLAGTPREVAEASDVVLTMVGYPSDVRETYLGDRGVFAGARPGLVCLDHTSSDPDLAVELAELGVAKGVAVLDAPVSGGENGAVAGKLSVMLGGDEAACAAVAPLLACYAATVVRQGGAGAGQRTKLVNQILIASTMVAVCEGLLFARRAGLDPETVLKSVGGGAAASQALVVLGPRMLKGDFAAGFYVEHFVKDLGLALDQCRRLNLRLPGLELASGLYGRLVAMGHARLGTQALLLVLDAMNTPGETR